jgi:ribulose-5-phosphate 4-epimerase/fuculose-1-phosphate aldolase/quinol monooxygenase YgiN
MNEAELRSRLAALGRSLFERGYVSGSAGNLSVRTADAVLVTPTNSCLGRLDPARIAKVDLDGRPLAGDPPSKETFLHLAVYRSRPDDRAVVHLHSPNAAAVSCLADLDPADVLPALTPYYALRVGRLPLVPYFPPGHADLALATGEAAKRSRAVLLANHGPVVAGSDLDAAVNAAEELEESARLYLLLGGRPVRSLTPGQRSALSGAPAPGPALAVLVSFRAKADRAAAFREAVLRQAANSLAREAACRRFDVCLDPKDPSRVFLYEIYDDDASFETHLRTEHFLAFDRTVKDWIEEKRVERWTLS